MKWTVQVASFAAVFFFWRASTCIGNEVIGWSFASGGGVVLSDFAGSVQVSSGNEFNLGLQTNGTVIGRFFSGDPVPLPSGLTDVVAVNASPLRGEQIGFSLALKANGTVISIGYQNSWNGGDYDVPVPEGLSNIVSVSSGVNHALALKQDGTVRAWGYNGSGETDVPLGLSNVVMIAAGLYSSLALKADGKVVGWGNLYPDVTTPPPGLSNVVAIAVGSFYAVALKADGRITAWGNTLNVPAGLSNVVAISASGGHSLALRRDGTTIGWGSYYAGIENMPTWLTNVISISAGPFSTALVGDAAPLQNSQITDAVMKGQDFCVSIATQNGRVYCLEYVGSLTNKDWTALELVAGNGGSLELRDHLPANTSARFYRIRRW